MTAYKKSLRAYKGKTGIVQVWGAEGNQPELAGGAPPCWKRRLRREMARVQEEEPMA